MSERKSYLWENGDIVTCFPGNGRKIKKEDREKKRKYKFTYKHYRIIASAMARMWTIKKNNLIFITYTFPENIKDNENTNKAFKAHLKNLKKNYSLNAYLWVAERQKRGAIHYHCVYDLPFVDIRTINNSFAITCSRFGIRTAKNMVRLNPKGAKIDNKVGVIKYISKYCSKDIGETFASKNYSMTRNIQPNPVALSEGAKMDIEVFTKSEFKTKYVHVQHLDDSYRKFLREIIRNNTELDVKRTIKSDTKAYRIRIVTEYMQKYFAKHLEFM